MKANVLASIFGLNASASFEELNSASASNLENSQTMGLLETNGFSPNSNEKDKTKDLDPNQIKENFDIYISANSLIPVVGPLGVSDGSEDAAFSFDQDEINIYVVRKGDTFSGIAKMFGVTVDTILSANELKKGDKPKVGEILFILPFSGVEHKVIKGETLQGIAKKYKVDIEEIILYNHLEDSKIVVGDELIIPGGELLNETKQPSKNTSNIAKGNSYPSVTVSSGYFIHPLPGAKYVRGLSRSHKGVDFGAPTGTPIYAAAEGTVIVAKNGWNGGFGNVVFLRHPNGTQTVYAHMSRIATSSGARVGKGETIGYVGSTGRSSGPHLHFEVRGAKNFLDR